MKRKKSMIVIFLALLFIVSSFATNTSSFSIQKTSRTFKSQEQTNDSEYYALIIGIQRFADGDMYPEEDKIDDDAISIYNLLLNGSNWKEENIKLMLNEDATKDKIKGAIVNWLDEKEDENDIVLIYYVSHGWKLPFKKRQLGKACIFTYNVTEEHRIEDKITDKEFDSYVDELESKHIALILGSCYSGRMLALRQKGRVFLAAGGKYLFCGVDEDDTLGSGIFTHFLKMGFKGVADLNNDGWVTAEEAFIFAKRPTIHFSVFKQFPFVIKWMNKTIIWFFQIPRIYDKHPGGLKLYQYSTDL